jgi:hypothetical protein
LLLLEKNHSQTNQFSAQLFSIQPYAMNIALLQLHDSAALAWPASPPTLSSVMANPTLLRLHCAHTI